MTPVVYIVASAAPPVLHLADGIDALAAAGWQPGIVLTPTAASWVDVAALEKHTGHAVRVHPRKPWETDPLPKPDALVAAPLTFRSLNAWATGVPDTLATGLLCEYLGLGVRIVAAPVLAPSLRAHPAYANSVRTLRDAAIPVLEPDEITIDDGDTITLDWSHIVQALGAPPHK